MKTVKVRLNTVETVKNFVHTLSGFKSEFDLIDGSYAVDAKSILGIFTMNLDKSMELRIIDAHNEMKDVLYALTPFMAKA